jgi:hypothetical protein
MRFRSHGERQAAAISGARLFGGLATIGLAVCLLSAGVAGANDVPTTALGREATAVLAIEPLRDGERRVVEVQPGSLVQLDDPVFDPAVATFVVSGNDLVVTTANGGVLVLEAFFGPADPPTMLVVLGGPAISADELLARAEVSSDELAQAEAVSGIEVASGARQEVGGGGERAAIAAETRPRALELPDRRISPAPGPDAAGGAELAAIVPIVAWLVSRLDIGGSAEAAEVEEPPSVAAVPILDHVLAQLRIASAVERLQLVDGHLAVLQRLESHAREIEAAGRGGSQDVRAVQVAVLEARLAREDARLERDLAIDDHHDRFKYRLTAAPFPQWQSDPPRGLADMGREVAETHFVEANRQLRHLGHARESLAIVDELLPLIERLRAATAEEFEVGVADIRALHAAEATLLAARLRAVELVHAKLRAEAWLLAVMGELTDDAVVRQRRE